jgi:phospho-N-acetylmuramoyl-pentapeptide-transferase
MVLRDTIWAALIGFFVTLVICPKSIEILHQMKFGQQVRDDGPATHLRKQGTPTMGGIMILIGVFAGTIFFIPRYPEVLPVLFVTIGFGLVGFADDFLKIRKKQSEGLNPKQKILLQIVITAVFCVYMTVFSEAGTTMLIPFAKIPVTLPVLLFIPLLFFIVLGTDNGTNFTDGLDGLLSSVTIPVAILLGAVSVSRSWSISPVCGAMLGSLMAFLCFNANPAKVFMGDTGSLAIGGFVAASAMMMQIPLYIPVFGFIYLIEVVSVIIQVTYFRKTGGKRFFRMAPIHHHFEKGGAKEPQIVAWFSTATAVLCLIAWLGM